MTVPGTRVVDLTYRGHDYKHVAVDRINGDPSWWSFQDEASVRDEFWLIEPGDMVFDIGAAYGSYSLTALACGAEQVFAWSPQAHPGSEEGMQEAAFFRDSLALNDWSGRCLVYEEGLFNKTGWLNTVTQEFTTNEPDPTTFIKGGDVIRVRAFADWFDEEFVRRRMRFPERVWVKLDVEGAELQILQSIFRLLIAPAQPRILVENHNFKRETMEQEVRDLVTSWGYREVATRPYHSVSHSFYLPPER